VLRNLEGGATTHELVTAPQQSQQRPARDPIVRSKDPTTRRYVAVVDDGVAGAAAAVAVVVCF
jgi:hypothetical protein